MLSRAEQRGSGAMGMRSPVTWAGGQSPALLDAGVREGNSTFVVTPEDLGPAGWMSSSHPEALGTLLSTHTGGIWNPGTRGLAGCQAASKWQSQNSNSSHRH